MKRIGVVGAGQFGTALATDLIERGAEVVLLDLDREKVQKLSGVVTKAVQGDASDPQALEESGLPSCDVVVVCTGMNREGGVLATANLKDLGCRHIIAKAVSETHGRVLARVGADEVVYPERERAERLARALVSRTAVDFYEVLDGVSVVEMVAPARFIGRTLAELDVRRRYGLTVLAIKRAAVAAARPQHVVSPGGEDRLQAGDSLILFGPDGKLDALA